MIRVRLSLLVATTIGLLLTAFPTTSRSQTYSKAQLRDWETNPVWISMMDDSTANYFEAVAAFDTFWKNRELPVEEDEILGADRSDREDEGFLDRLFGISRRRERKEAALRSTYMLEVKKFRHWQLMVEPWIQEDGSITYPAQRVALLQQLR